MSKLYFRYGAMNSGKSALLLQVAHNYEECGKSVYLIKPEVDNKGGDRVISRVGLSRAVDLLFDNEYNLYEHFFNTSVDCILVDETQFITTKQANQLFKVAVELNMPVICYGLRTDFQGKGFEGSTRLLEIAHSLEELKTICKCGKKALLNARKINGFYTQDGDQISIDNKDCVQYDPMCGVCWYKNDLTFTF